MLRGLALFIAVLVFTANIASAKDHNVPSATEMLRVQLTQVQTDSAIGWSAKVLLQNLTEVQREIDRGTKLLKKQTYHISVVSVAMDSSQVYDCRGWEPREGLLTDILDKNHITWIGFPDTTMIACPTGVNCFSLESGDLYPFVQALHRVPVEHFAPGVYHDIAQLLDAVRAQQYTARTAIMLDHNHASSAAIVASPMFAWQIWSALGWMSPDDAAAYIPIDTNQVFYSNQK